MSFILSMTLSIICLYMSMYIQVELQVAVLLVVFSCDYELCVLLNYPSYMILNRC